MRRSAALAGAGTLVAIAVALAVVLGSSSRHAIASNYIRPTTFITRVEAGKRVCQANQDVPAGTGGVALRVGTFGKPGPPLELTMRERGRTIASGTREAGWKEGDIAISVPELASRHEVAEVCVRNDGSETIAVAGGSGSGAGAVVGGKPAAGAIRLTFLEPDKRSWYAFAPDVSRRISILRDAAPGGATLAVFCALMLAAVAGAFMIVLRAGRE